MERSSVANLISGCLAGDKEAREALVLAVQNRVFYHCRKMLKDEDDALDATQEILIAMLTKLDTLKEPAAFWGWLSAMTANYCRNVLRRGNREIQIPEDEEGNSMLDTFETLDEQAIPDKALDSEESRRMIMDLIDGLPEAQRLCVLMYYYDEMGVKDIAAALETSEGTIKSRLNYARKAIKEGVDRYAAQGVKLYGLAPLPFLAYILKQDALWSGMTAAQSAVCAKAALAGSSAALASGAAVGGSAAGAGAAATGTTAGAAGAAASTGTAGNTLTAVFLAHKGVSAAVAGLVLTGAIGGAVLLSPPEQPAQETQPPAVEVVQPNAQPEPAVEPEPGLPQEPEPQPQAELPQEPEPEPETVTQPQPEPVTQPEPQPQSPPQIQMRFYEHTGPYGRSFGFPISSMGGANTKMNEIVYTSSNPSVAEVTQTGTVVLLSPGTATITATFPADDNYQIQLPVTVENRYLWEYKFSQDPLTLSVGSTGSNYLAQLSWNSADNQILSVAWESSNPSVATVTDASNTQNDFVQCKVEGRSAGTATITGRATINSVTPVGMRTMMATMSFQVIVT